MKQMQQAVNAARYQRKLKHIRKVKAAIRYQEAAQRQRHIAGKKKKEIRDYARSIQLAENVKYSAAKEAAKGSKQDWRLGQLRPNRAIGSGAERYGVFPQEWNRLMELPEEWRDGRLFKENKGKTKKVPEYLLSEHLLMPHWPIVEGDRVVVIRGVHRNKIGTVERVDARRNTITISGITILVGSETIRSGPEKADGPTTIISMPFPYEDVRLVAPFDFEERRGGHIIKSRRDVIVDKVIVERHTTGTDPFTQNENVRDIPEEHQVDPITREPIYHRYVAGSRQPIPWPWEVEEREKAKAAVPEEKKKDGLLRKANPLSWFRKGEKDKDAASTSESTASMQETSHYDPKTIIRGRRYREPEPSPDDTTRNLVELGDDDMGAFRPTLFHPPMPLAIVSELGVRRPRRSEDSDRRSEDSDRRSEDSDRRSEAAEEKEKPVPRKTLEKLAAEEERQRLISTMKTPMQIRWELEQAKKEKHDPAAPAPLPKDLLLALGKHMASNGKKLDKEAYEKARLHAMRVEAAKAEAAKQETLAA